MLCGFQASASANAQAWAAAEASLTARLSDSDAAAAAAVERERRAWEKLQAANSRIAATAAAIDALKAELADAHAGDGAFAPQTYVSPFLFAQRKTCA